MTNSSLSLLKASTHEGARCPAAHHLAPRNASGQLNLYSSLRSAGPRGVTRKYLNCQNDFSKRYQTYTYSIPPTDKSNRDGGKYLGHTQPTMQIQRAYIHELPYDLEYRSRNRRSRLARYRNGITYNGEMDKGNKTKKFCVRNKNLQCRIPSTSNKSNCYRVMLLLSSRRLDHAHSLNTRTHS